jgi:hypothetical protein
MMTQTTMFSNGHGILIEGELEVMSEGRLLHMVAHRQVAPRH